MKKKKSNDMGLRINVLGLIGFVLLIIGIWFLPHSEAVCGIFSVVSLVLGVHCIYEYSHMLNLITICLSLITLFMIVFI